MVEKRVRKSLGRTAAEQEERASAFDGDIWIKGFKSGENRIRILQEPPTWKYYLEHFIPDIGSFACTEDKECLGCAWMKENNPERVPDRRYAFNALDSQGRLNLYKVGMSVYKTLNNRYKRMEVPTIMDRDFIIIKTGAGLGTTYEVDPGDKYPTDFRGELIDITKVIDDKYYDQVEPKLSEIIATPKGEPDSPDEVESKFDKMTNDELKAYIVKFSGEDALPARPSRAKLIAIAEDVPPF